MKKAAKNGGRYFYNRAGLFVGAVVIVAAISVALKGVRSGSANVNLAAAEKTQASSTPSSSAHSSISQPPSLHELLQLSPRQLDSVDIGLMNLLCAQGLRGAESLDVQEAMAKLDGLARHIERETTRHQHRFRDKPEEFNHSQAYFRCLFLAVVLQEDLGIHYNPDRITNPGVFEPNEVFFADARDVFIHGLTGERRLGTCSSLPVFYVAIGRRLGYPLKLAAAKNHLFVRWEDSRERFNFDATGRGFNPFDDDHYRAWPRPISAQEERDFGYLKSFTPTQELAAFLSLRGHCLMAAGLFEDAVAAQAEALHLAPDSRIQQIHFALAREEAAHKLQPPVPIPPDPILQITGDAADWATRRADIQSMRQRGNSFDLPPDPTPKLSPQSAHKPQPNTFDRKPRP